MDEMNTSFLLDMSDRLQKRNATITRLRAACVTLLVICCTLAAVVVWR